MKDDFIPFGLPEIGDEEVAAVTAVLRSGWVTTGPRAREFEQQFVAVLGGDVEAIAVNSATAGLHLALEALGIGPGDEVITIWMATGRRVPPGDSPISIGVVVNNPLTLINVARAVDDERGLSTIADMRPLNAHGPDNELRGKAQLAERLLNMKCGAGRERGKLGEIGWPHLGLL